MKEFFAYFFGAGDEIEFRYFTLAHILPIVVMLGVIALIIIYGKKIKEWKHEGKLRMALAFTMIITEMSYFWRLVGVESLNANPTSHLPITVCGWAIIFSSYLIVTKSQNLFDIVYFWVFAGSTFGLLTPTVITYCGPTRFRYYQFWLEHTLGFITLFYMMFVHGMRPNIKSMIKSYCALMVLGVVAIFANNMLPGANYLFMAKTADAASILDILPKNYVVRVIVMALVMASLFVVAYIPWLVKDIKAKKRLALVGVAPETTDVEEVETIKTNNVVEETVVAQEIKQKKSSVSKDNKESNNTSSEKPKRKTKKD